ncbi:proteasome subunit beta [Candidatus Woesearchaeota archaeon]|nr:MAG: proteasome subunit beta [Candidatus Woesearchaeota archaeon]
MTSEHFRGVIIMEDKIKHGTTTVGIVCKDGVVLAADKRASMGHMVSNKKENKIHQVANYMAITTAGLVSDAQLFTRIIKAQLSLLKIRKNKEPTVKEAANMLASMSYASIRRPSMVPSIVGFLLGGYDKTGYHLYEIGVDGSVSEADDFKTDGSGGSFALGVLENNYTKDMTIEDGIKLAKDALNVSLQRDVYTGNGVDIFTVNEEGVKKVQSHKINTGLKN